MPLILASSSPYRRALLRRLNLPFSVESPDIDERPRPAETPLDLPCTRQRISPSCGSGRSWHRRVNCAAITLPSRLCPARANPLASMTMKFVARENSR